MNVPALTPEECIALAGRAQDQRPGPSIHRLDGMTHQSPDPQGNRPTPRLHSGSDRLERELYSRGHDVHPERRPRCVRAILGTGFHDESRRQSWQKFSAGGRPLACKPGTTRKQPGSRCWGAPRNQPPGHTSCRSLTDSFSFEIECPREVAFAVEEPDFHLEAHFPRAGNAGSGPIRAGLRGSSRSLPDSS